MSHVFRILAIVALVSFCSCVNAAKGQHQHEWVRVDDVDNLVGESIAVSTIRVELVQRNLDLLHQEWLRRSDPESPVYGEWLSNSDIASLIAPPTDRLEAVLQWLACGSSHDVTCNVGPHSDTVTVSFPVARAAALFGASLAPFRHSTNNKLGVIYRSDKVEASVPPHLLDVVARISLFSDFPVVPKRARVHVKSPMSEVVEVGADPGDDITPPVIQSLYSISAQGSQSSNGQGVAEFEQAAFYPSDLANFQRKYKLKVEPAEVVGGNDPDDGYLGECSLDVEYVAAAGRGVKVWVFSVPNSGFDLTSWAQNVSSTPNAPKVHSISWGSPESEFEANVLERTSTEFAKLGVAGHTIFVASGDEGTGHSGLFTCGHFEPGYPASSPYVTAVGGTYLQNGQEIGWVDSGGGFSNHWGRQPWQATAVQEYLNAGDLPESKYFNATGRAIPDVAALSTNFQTLIQNFTGSISGTSAASPVFAGIIALVNDARLAQGKSVVGPLNQALYAAGKVGTDVTDGENKSSPCREGFKARAGWDPVTGLGTPNFELLVKTLAS